MDFAHLVNDLFVIFGAGGFAGALVKWFIKNGPKVEKVAEEGAKVLAEIPAAKAAEMELHHKLNDALDNFKKSELGRLAAEALNYTVKDLSELSDVQVNALALHISTLVPKEWNVSEKQIVEALQLAQKASDAVAGNPLVQAADKFTAEKQAAAQPVETAQTPA